MRIKKNYLIFFLIFIIFSTYSPKKSFEYNFFSIDEIILLKNESNNLNIVDNELKFIKGKNIITISQADFKNIIEKYPLIKEIKIKKVYPNNKSLKLLNSNKYQRIL